MAGIIPYEVTNSRELTTAIETKEKAILIKDEEMFWKMEKEIQRSKTGKKAKKISKTTGLVGAIWALATPLAVGLYIAIATIGTATAAGLTGAVADKFKEYRLQIYYKEHTILMIKENGSNSFDKKNDSIIGIESLSL